MNNIKELRIKKKISQIKMSKELGVAQNTISQWENNTRQPDNDMLKALSNYFKVSIDYILNQQTHESIKEEYSAFEKECITLVRNLDEDGKKYIFETLEMAQLRYAKNSEKKANDK